MITLIFVDKNVILLKKHNLYGFNVESYPITLVFIALFLCTISVFAILLWSII